MYIWFSIDIPLGGKKRFFLSFLFTYFLDLQAKVGQCNPHFFSAKIRNLERKKKKSAKQ